MKISELIEILEVKKKEFGDVEAVVKGTEYFGATYLPIELKDENIYVAHTLDPENIFTGDLIKALIIDHKQNK